MIRHTGKTWPSFRSCIGFDKNLVNSSLGYRSYPVKCQLVLDIFPALGNEAELPVDVTLSQGNVTDCLTPQSMDDDTSERGNKRYRASKWRRSIICGVYKLAARLNIWYRCLINTLHVRWPYGPLTMIYNIMYGCQHTNNMALTP